MVWHVCSEAVNVRGAVLREMLADKTHNRHTLVCTGRVATHSTAQQC